MKIQNLKLNYFRCFECESIDFDERLTVLVGKNGSGKSAILDSLAIMLNIIIKSYIGVCNNPDLYNINFDRDKKNSSTENPTLKMDISFNDKKYTIKNPACSKLKKNHINFVVNISNYGICINKQLIYDINLCKEKNIFLYIGTRHLYSQSEFPDIANNILNGAYKQCFYPEINFKDIIDWIDKHDADEARSFREGERDYHDPELTAMREAVEKALPEFNGLRFRGTTNEILVTRKIDGEILSFWQLSAGYQAMLALILDLARRMALANGELYAKDGRSILESPAIVLIDEIEMHLHPSWQQTVLPSLLNIFPNTQFIVTTHSPQILSSIMPHHIRLLDNGHCQKYDGVTFGAESSRLLEDIFGTELRAKSEAKEILDNYLRLIDSGEYTSSEAKECRIKLDKWMYGDPILDYADMLIRRAERLKTRESGNA